MQENFLISLTGGGFKKLNIMGQCISIYISRYTYIGKYSYISEIGLDYWGLSFFFFKKFTLNSRNKLSFVDKDDTMEK